jgi:tetratricopeptide (TPR) repeat protein
LAQGKYVLAETLYGQTLEMQRRVLGPEHSNTLDSMTDLAATYAAQGMSVQAEQLFNQTLEIRRLVLGPEHPGTLSTLAMIASMYQRESQYAKAETYAAQALAGRRHALGSDDPDAMSSAEDLALAYLSQKKFAEAEPLSREALEFNQKKQPDDWQRGRAESLLGASLAGQKKYAEAEPLLLEGYGGMVARKDRIAVPDWYNLDLARNWLVELYQAWGKPAKVAEWRKNSQASSIASPNLVTSSK